MEEQIKQYSEEEASAAIALLILAVGGFPPALNYSRDMVRGERRHG